MKKFLSILLLFGVLSCDSFLEEPARSTPTLADIFNSESAAVSFVNGAYANMLESDWWQINFFRQITDMATDDGWAGNTEQPRPDITSISHYNNIDIGSSYFQTFWNYQFRGITKCNIIIQEIEKVNFDEELKRRLIGEAKFLRGFFYFELVKNFGGVPIVRTFNELLRPEVTQYSRSTQDEVYDLIEQDFLDAIDRLPLKSQYAASDLGRATKGAAQAFLAKVYLYREKWTDAARLTGEIINSGEYQLESDFSKVWNVTNPNGIESVFEVQYKSDPTFRIGGVFGVTTGSRNDGGWNWGVPSSHLEKAFLEEGDVIRLRNTIIKHGEPVFGDPAVQSFNAAPDRNKSGRINRKFYIPQGQRPIPYVQTNLPLNHILMRYADVILMHAEASYFIGNRTAALNSLAIIRNRVNLPTDMSLSGDRLRDAIWKERRLELALEQQRLYDIRRQKVNGVPVINSIFGPNGSFVVYNTQISTDPFELGNVNEDQSKGRTFDPSKHLLWPIPISEILLSNGRIVQNPNY